MRDEKIVELRGSGMWSPDEIFDGAKEEWRRVVASAELGHFVREDSPWFAEYCLAIVLSRMAHAEIDTAGMLPHGKTSPWVTISNRQTMTMITMSTHLNLNPQSRFYRSKKAQLLAAVPAIDRPALKARFDALEKQLKEAELALNAMEGVRAVLEAIELEVEQLVCGLLGEDADE